MATLLRGTQRIVLISVVFGALTALLTGCVSSYSPFDVERSEKDALPESVQTDSVLRDSSRLVGSHDNISFYAAKPLDHKLVACVVASKDGERLLEGCGSGATFGLSVPGLLVRYYAESYGGSPERPWVKISPNLLARIGS
ncbi:hypothetical protein AB4Z18_18830 [Leifsonia sp. 2TAF2]|uniref:hypothetical protein n=1 Tax=Leifsonia sp. 2TAF2 TaxID=3233009 RepID=UPI003F958327